MRNNNDPFDCCQQGSLMTVNGLFCELNMPKALVSRANGQGQEWTHGLPPYNRRPAFPVGEYPACPASWMRGSPTQASYFVPVLAEHGLWLDFNANRGHTHDVAVLLSIQGINPITGRKAEGFSLEQYREKCPTHDVPFEAERFCPKCGYKWDAQNYLASNATPSGLYWLDGFRAEDGVTRQYVFTADAIRGVAAQLIGEARVFAIGIAFFLSKERKPPTPLPQFRKRSVMPGFGHDDCLFTMSLQGMGGEHHELFASSGSDDGYRGSPAMFEAGPALEIAAGAKIDQRIYPDPWDLGKWEETPAGTIYINYVDVATAQGIIAAGKRDLTAGGEGFMDGLNVGHPANV